MDLQTIGLRSYNGGMAYCVASDEQLIGTPPSGREMDVIHEIIEGRRIGEAAERVGISRHTAKSHLSTLYRRLGARCKTEAIYLMVVRGMVEL